MGEGAGLQWLLLAASCAPQPGVQYQVQVRSEAPWAAHQSLNAPALCNLRQTASFAPLKHGGPKLGPSLALTKTEVASPYYHKQISKREDPQ